MGLRQTFKMSDVDAYIKRRLDVIDQVIVRRLQYLGEKLVNHAREYGSYIDQTGNLRNSVGYVIVKNGRVIESNFDKTSSKPGPDGSSKAKSLADTLASKYTKGYSLICVAGMNYSAAVEARGRNVLASAEEIGKSDFPRMVSELKLNIKNMK